MYKTKHDFDLQGDVERIKEAFADAAIDVRDKAGKVLTKTVNTAKKRSKHLTKGISHYAAKQPMKTIGLSVLFGFVIGYLLNK